MTLPCPDCPPHVCHASEINGYQHNRHVRAIAYTHNGDKVEYCTRCLVKVTFVNNLWQADITIKEWP